MIFGDSSLNESSGENDDLLNATAEIIKTKHAEEQIANLIHHSSYSSDKKIMEIGRWQAGRLTEEESQYVQNIVSGVKNPSMISIIQSGNLYNYCVNNPLMYVDPSGEWAKGIGVTLYVSFIIRIEIQGYYVWDDNGNEGIILIAGGGGGTPNAGISGSKFTTKSADTIFDLEGISLGVGGSFGYVGVDVNGDLGGGSISGGPSVLPMEMHGTITLGKIIFNW